MPSRIYQRISNVCRGTGAAIFTLRAETGGEMNILEALNITLGPWTVNDDSEYLNRKRIEPCIGETFGAGKELDANSRAIAASPQMLEALIDLISLKEYESVIDCEGNGWLEKDARGIARLEIARYSDIVESATGKSWEEIKALMEDKGVTNND